MQTTHDLVLKEIPMDTPELILERAFKRFVDVQIAGLEREEKKPKR